MTNNPTSRRSKLRARAERDRGTAHNYVTVNPDELIELLDELEALQDRDTTGTVSGTMDAVERCLELECQLADAEREIERLTEDARHAKAITQAERLDHISTLGQAGELERQLTATRAALAEACELAINLLNGIGVGISASERIRELHSLATTHDSRQP